MNTIELTDREVKHLQKLLGHSSTCEAIKAKLTALNLPKDPVRCYHCREEQQTEAAYVKHLIRVHLYEDDAYGEDTAQTEAWSAFHAVGR